MGDYNIFITWSGVRSEYAAKALRKWLPNVLQIAKPWMSEVDIEKGARSFQEIDKQLQGIGVGIICLTPENLAASWISFEAGALSKGIGDSTRVCTLLLGGLERQNVPYPLAMFQFTKPIKEDIRKLLGTINNALANPLAAEQLDFIFERTWNDLDKELNNLPHLDSVPAQKRSVQDIVEELLDIARADNNRRKKSEWMDEYGQELQQIFPTIAHLLRMLPPTLNAPMAATGAPPISMSNVEVKELTPFRARINWTTSIPGNSQVKYGTSIRYGMSTTVQSEPTNSHSVLLTNLIPNCLYHFAPISTTIDGVSMTGFDHTLTTLPVSTKLDSE